MLTFGVVVLAVTDRRRPEEFSCAVLRCEVHTDGFGGWAGVLIPPIGTGTMIALQTSETPPKAPQQPTTLTGRPLRRPPGIKKTRPISWRSLRRHGRRVRRSEGGNRVVLDRGPELGVERRVRHKVAVHGLRGRGHEGPGIGD